MFDSITAQCAAATKHPAGLVTLNRRFRSSRHAFLAFSSTFRRSNVRTCQRSLDLSPLLPATPALFCTFLHLRKPQLFSFQSLPHSPSTNTITGASPPPLRGPI